MVVELELLGVDVNVGMATIFGDMAMVKGVEDVLGSGISMEGVVKDVPPPVCTAASSPIMAASASTISCSIPETSVLRVTI